MTYKFKNFQVENISEMDLENMLDLVIDLYLGILGTDAEEIKHVFELEGLTVTKIEDSIINNQEK